ncbi:MAG: restriction endonuclease subunit S [Betaproteobacteria bacterium]
MSFDLPALPEEWQFLPLEKCAVPASISYGVVQPGTPTNTGVPIIRVNNFSDGRLDLSDVMRIAPEVESKYTRTRLSGGEVLLTLVGSVGQVAEVPLNCAGFNVARAVGVIRPANGLESKWLAICLRSPLSQQLLGSRANTTVQTTINLKDVRALPVPIPPAAERAQISEMVGTLDDRIALLRETNATLEAIAQALFKSWFVDFDPVRAKSQGLAPAGMDEATAALFPDSFEESALGSVPKGWVVQPVGDAVECVGGATPDTKDPSYWSPEEHAWTTPKDLSGLPAPVLLSTERRLSTKGLTKIGSGLLPVGTLLMSSRAPIGYLAIAQVPVAINQGYIAMLPGSLLPPLYMLFWCQQNMEGIKSRANGSTFMEISKKAFRPIPALVPSSAVIEAFLAIASPLFDRLVANERAAQTLATLRDTLLPRLISGQLRLPEVAAIDRLAHAS